MIDARTGVWNTGLEQRREYRRRGAFIGYAGQCKQLTEAKRDFGWLADAPSHVLQQTLKDLDQVVKPTGRGRSGGDRIARGRRRSGSPTPSRLLWNESAAAGAG